MPWSGNFSVFWPCFNQNSWSLNGFKFSNLQAGAYVWLTYGEAHDAALRMGSAIRSRSLNPISSHDNSFFWFDLLFSCFDFKVFRLHAYTHLNLTCWVMWVQGDLCGIYRFNCPEWIISMEVFSISIHL